MKNDVRRTYPSARRLEFSCSREDSFGAVRSSVVKMVDKLETFFAAIRLMAFRSGRLRVAMQPWGRLFCQQKANKGGTV
jgi:hypothetical protein